ncbi:amine oxidase, flavin-containing superfamily [Corynespora cassiicola Philippines]|uniref:Amine oxidase, flavin-containing superfamily n=1 Tax=Corynespora cassiicola Philippines TaxID=1448308 RepID=A0A2T2NFD3_CORCC|nr:amine oxidase, flavin-containing superfamily [Corynespora cassiicola Philippines]
MRFHALPLVSSISFLIQSAHTSPPEVIYRDVAIIGGGSAGTYSAIALKDKGFSTIVIEKKDRIGGHTETYTDPATGVPIDMGVIIFHDIPTVKNYFSRFNLSLTPIPTLSSGTAGVYDLRYGTALNVTRPSQEELGAAFQKFAAILSQWPQLAVGQFLPDPIPEDLLLPFGEFCKKHGIEAILPTASSYNPGLGDPLTVPTLEQIKVFGLGVIQSFNSFLTSANFNNSLLYAAAQAELLASNSLLLNSQVTKSERTNSSVKLYVDTPTCKQIIIAKKLLITIPAKTDYLKPFDLSAREKSVFKKFINGGYYTSVVKNTGLPANLSITNNAAGTPYNFIDLPGTYQISATGAPNLHTVYYGAPRTKNTVPIPEEQVKASIIADLKRLQAANPGTFTKTEPEFAIFSSHAPFYLQVTAEDIKNGFYAQLYALQGERNTYWNGASFAAHDSSTIWQFTDNVVLPQLVAGL